MKLWIARNKRGYLWVFDSEPIATKYGDWEAGKGMDKIWAIPNSSLFPEVTFENSPQEVEIKLV